MQLRTRLTLRSMGFVSALLLAFTLLAYAGLSWVLLRQVDQALAAGARELVAAQPPGTGATIRTWTPAQGPLPLASMTAWWEEAGSPVARPAPIDLSEALTAEQPASQSIRGQDDTWFRVRIEPYDAAPGRQGHVVVIASLAPVHALLSTARTVLLLVGGVVWLVGLIFARRFSRKTVAPLETLLRTANDIMLAGQFEHHMRIPKSAAEVGPLVAVWNDLLATVEQNLVLQRQFLANTSHELRSPLTVILANLTFLQRDLTPEERAISINESLAEAQRMKRLVNDLLLLARSNPALMIERVPVRLDLLIEERVAGLLRQTTTHIISWSAPEPVTVLGDEERLTQLLRNLVENAIQHTPPGTAIHVELQCGARFAKLIVQDNGPGIAAQHLPHIWDRFYQVDRARPRSAGGTGLGLPIVLYIVEAHGGSVRLTTRVGAGTKFTITLPYLQVPSEDPADADSPATATP